MKKEELYRKVCWTPSTETDKINKNNSLGRLKRIIELQGYLEQQRTRFRNNLRIPWIRSHQTEKINKFIEKSQTMIVDSTQVRKI